MFFNLSEAKPQSDYGSRRRKVRARMRRDRLPPHASHVVTPRHDCGI